MTIKLDSATKHKLIFDVAEGLKAVTVSHGSLIMASQFEWANKLSDTLTDDQKNKLHRYCG